MSKKSILASVTGIALCCSMLCACSDAAPAVESSPSPAESDNAAKVIEDIATTQAFTDEAVSAEDIAAIVNAGVNAPSSMNAQPWHFSVITSRDVLQEISDGMSFGMTGGGFPGMPNGKPGEMPENGEMPEPPEGFEPPEGTDGEMPEMPEKPENGEMPEPLEGFEPPDGADGEMPEMPEKPENGEMPEMPSGSAPNTDITDIPLVIVVSCKSGSELDAGLALQNMSAEAQLLGYGTKLSASQTIALNGEKQAEFKELLGIPDDMTAVCLLLIGKADTEGSDAVTGATERNSIDEVVTYVQ